LGGSTTWGYFAPDELTISDYLQENFNQQNTKKRIEVINAGMPAYNSNDELNLIKNKIVHYNPDLIIVYDGLNDIWFPYNSTTNAKEVGLIQHTIRKYFQFYKTPQVISNIIEEPRTLFATSKNVHYDVDDRAELWKNNLSTICEIGKHEGFETLIFLQPFVGTGNKDLTDGEKRMLDKKVLEKRPNAFLHYSYFGEKLNDLNQTCIGTFNLTNVFDDVKNQVYFDGYHVFPQYNELLADVIFQSVFPIINQHMSKL